MDAILFLMDLFSNSFHHLGHLERRFPATAPLEAVGYVARKTDWVRHQFASYNFSFILSGGGEYWRNGAMWPVRAPCVITQEPGVMYEYGPSGEWSEWEELFLIYNKGQIPALEKMGLIRRATPAWNIKDIGPTRSRIQELMELIVEKPATAAMDRLDRLCELMVLESIAGETHASVDRDQRAIQSIRDLVKADIHSHHDFHALAREHGLSASTFRRRWEEMIGMPPARFAMRLKMEEACRLLVETRLKVGEIGESLGFNDPLYFSRRFRLEKGISAIEYRRRYQSPLSFAV